MAGTSVLCHCGLENPVPRLADLKGRAGPAHAAESTGGVPDDPAPLLAADVRRGQVMVVCIIVFFLAISIAVAVLRIRVLGRQPLIAANPIRILLEVALAVCLYLGYTWARYVTASILGVATLVLLAHVPTLREAPVGVTVCFLVVTLGFGCSAIALAKSQDIRDFMEHQRRKPHH
jgi:hypothetical protein